MNKRIVFLDIDGTLTEPGSNVPPETALYAIRKAQEQGHYIFLCTGRNYAMLAPLLRYGFDGIVGSAGGYIEVGGKVIYDCPMTEEQRVAAMDVLKKNGIFRTVECKEGSYSDAELKEFLRKRAKKDGNSELLRWREQLEKSLNIEPMEKYQNQPVYKIVVMAESAEQFEEPKKVLGDDFSFVMQEPGENGLINGELINRKFDKGRGVERVCRYLNIPVKQTIGFGDSMNDYEIIREAGLGIAMGNACEELKNAADYVTDDIDRDGVWNACRHFGLI